jgi:hypothetical protein
MIDWFLFDDSARKIIEDVAEGVLLKKISGQRYCTVLVHEASDTLKNWISRTRFFEHVKILGNRYNSGEIRSKPMFERAKQHLRWSLAKSFPPKGVPYATGTCYGRTGDLKTLSQTMKYFTSRCFNCSFIHRPIGQSSNRDVLGLSLSGVVSGQSCTREREGIYP